VRTWRTCTARQNAQAMKELHQRGNERGCQVGAMIEKYKKNIQTVFARPHTHAPKRHCDTPNILLEALRSVGFAFPRRGCIFPDILHYSGQQKIFLDVLALNARSISSFLILKKMNEIKLQHT
jgi:hypothetical protein